jgi:hypothetical protein
MRKLVASATPARSPSKKETAMSRTVKTMFVALAVASVIAASGGLLAPSSSASAAINNGVGGPDKKMTDLEHDGYTCGRIGVGGYSCTKPGAPDYLCDNAGNCSSAKVAPTPSLPRLGVIATYPAQRVIVGP